MASASVTSYADGMLYALEPAVDDAPVEVPEERLDVCGAVGLVVEEVGVLVHVERDERRRVPDGERVLRVADVVEEPALVPVERRPGPAAACHSRSLEVGAPGVDRAEVALDQLRDRSVGSPPSPPRCSK